MSVECRNGTGKSRRHLCLTVLLLLAVAMGASGCATSAMRGTPYYTDTYRAKTTASGDPVNLWPLFYYRKPVLEILWPLTESTDNYFAIRPLLSVYGTSEAKRVTSVLWPIASFDGRRNDYRVFPAFWGPNRFAVFPLYWHWTDPDGHAGVFDTLFPLWSHYRVPDGYSTHLLWPFLHFKELRGRSGWRVWPLYGNYRSTASDYRFYLWPLGHSRTWAGQNREHMFFPLYYWKQTPRDSLFLSLLYSQGTESDDAVWRLLIPLFFQSRNGQSSSLVTPFFWTGRNAAEDRDWSALVPLYFTARNGDSRFLATLLGGYSRKGDSRSWMALPLLSGGRKSQDSSDLWMVGPAAHIGTRRDGGGSHVFPLYYHTRDGRKSMFLSLPWCSGRNGDEASWQLMPPVFFRKHDADGRTIVSLLCYWDNEDGTFVSPLIARWKSGGNRAMTFVPPLLSLYAADAGRKDLWALGGMARWSWGEEPGPRYLLPLVYSNGRTGTFVSPLAAKWRRDADTSTTMFPPALSWLTAAERRKDLWVLGPLAHFSWGPDAGGQHVFPLYYANRTDGTFLSPLFADWKDGDIRRWMCPILLSGGSSDGARKTLNLALGMFHEEWGGAERSGHLVPLYAYRGTREFYTPLVGWDRDKRDGFFYPLTPLLGFRTGEYSGGWLFPLFSHRGAEKTGNYSGTFLWGSYSRSGRQTRSGLFPIYGYSNDGPFDAAPTEAKSRSSYGKKFWSVPACWYENRLAVYPDNRGQGNGGTVRRYDRKHGFFPLWSYSSRTMPDREIEDVDGSLLWLLYDYNRRGRPAEEAVRARVLWRLWYYERNNGAVEMDMFPAITYRRDTTGNRKISFLWRLFRYERSDTGRKLDLFFLPLMR